MFKKIKISTKITTIILIISLVAVSAISFFTYDYSIKANHEKYTTNLTVIAQNRAEHFELFFDKVITGVKVIQNAKELAQDQETTSANSFGMDAMLMDMFMEMEAADSTETTEPEDPIDKALAMYKKTFGFDQIYLTSPTGNIFHSTDPNLRSGKNFRDPDGNTLSKGKTGIFFGPVEKPSTESPYTMVVSAPLKTSDAGSLLIIKLDLTKPYEILQDYRGLGETGEIVLASVSPEQLDSEEILKSHFICPFRNDSITSIRPVNKYMESFVSRTYKEGESVANGQDYRGIQNTMIGRTIDNSTWVLIAKMNLDEARGNSGNVIKTVAYAGAFVLVLAILLSMIFSRSLTRPLMDMKSTLGMVAQGMLPEKTESHGNDEFGQMASKVDDLVDLLKENAEFAKRVGEGKYNTEFKAASENDVLGTSLLNMRENLIENERKDKERNWIVRGVAEISEILRLHDTLDPLGDDVIKFIIEKIGAVQGAFYVVNDEDGDEKYIELRASYAFGRKKYLKNTFKFAEGLVGQAAIEKDLILRTEIPSDYVTITSGILGDQRPTCILISPLITNEAVFGVIELAGFKKFDSSQVNFVQELSLILARTIFNIKVNERTRKLLAESQEMSAELKEKQEVLRQNAEEMQATQEELRRTNQRLEEQIEEVNNTQKRMQLLLENASEVITIYEENETIRYISPSVETILGYGQKELIGKTDRDFVHQEHTSVYAEIFQRMISNPDERVTVQYQYKTKEGKYIWIESTGTNCMSNPAIHGYILNSRDITERRMAEQEQRMRSKMQALSENSPDLITRLEHESISYINPVIEAYTGNPPSNFLNKNVHEVDLDRTVLEKWLEIVEEVNRTNNKVATEMDFPSEMGSRVMQVNAIPEYDETQHLESVLVVSHDITDRKMIELEIQNKNKKITESINYAKRIQNAILPNNRIINRALPNSFILYKPRDVVSGDFPWYVQIKEDIFIAAVDCTGHGVPGALLSLIGYFLLNDIVKSRKITEPGVILDLLDEGVTSTLRQDEDAATKDGMDIALCKINLNKREVEYAGAHRPLYIMKAGEMEEIKGNKFPIGGGIFKNQTNFTNHKLTLKAGDSIFFSSDGYPDQFGGPQGRKFGPKRVREMITRIHTQKMNEAMNVFDQEWETWRGNTKQTDDVLLIGIKF